MIGLHIWSAVKLSAENKAARPVPYANWNSTVASYASRTMLMSGLIIFAFIIYHLLHYTVMVKAINLTGQDFHTLKDAQGRHDIFTMMVTGFRNPVVSLFYVPPSGCFACTFRPRRNACFTARPEKRPARRD
jgi:succinate dehydrogenase / fumarate reductase cytochrome b subunit